MIHEINIVTTISNSSSFFTQRIKIGCEVIEIWTIDKNERILHEKTFEFCDMEELYLFLLMARECDNRISEDLITSIKDYFERCE